MVIPSPAEENFWYLDQNSWQTILLPPVSFPVKDHLSKTSGNGALPWFFCLHPNMSLSSRTKFLLYVPFPVNHRFQNSNLLIGNQRKNLFWFCQPRHCLNHGRHDKKYFHCQLHLGVEHEDLIWMYGTQCKGKKDCMLSAGSEWKWAPRLSKLWCLHILLLGEDSSRSQTGHLWTSGIRQRYLGFQVSSVHLSFLGRARKVCKL